MKLYYATRAITETVEWAAAWIVLAVLIGDIAEWFVLFLIGFIVWSAWGSNSAMTNLRRECQAEQRWTAEP